jgi:hypothetical protein
VYPLEYKQWYRYADDQPTDDRRPTTARLTTAA